MAKSDQRADIFLAGSKSLSRTPELLFSISLQICAIYCKHSVVI